MKFTKYTTVPLTYAICLVLLANEATASTPQPLQDMSQWTQDQVRTYFDKYNIVLTDDDNTLSDTAQRYHDRAAANARLFLADKSNSVTRLMERLKIKLEKHYHLSSNAVDGLTRDLSHELKQLELSGQLTHDRVKQTLDSYQTRALRQGYITEAQWKTIANDIQGSFFTAPSSSWWYQRFFGKETKHDSDDNAFQTWFSTALTNRIEENKELTKQEMEAVARTVKRAITTTTASGQDLTKLATKDWWQQLGEDLEHEAKLKHNQIEDVLASLKDEIIAYKMFAMDYAGDTVNAAHGLLASVSQYVKDLYDTVAKTFQHKQTQLRDAAVDTASSVHSGATEAASSVHSGATEAASSLRSEATDTYHDAKDSLAQEAADRANAIKEHADNTKKGFGRFWHNKELELYRKMGYTEAHIHWLENYLSTTFHDKKQATKEAKQHAMQTIRDYLVQAKVQTVAGIDAQIKSIEGLLNSWRQSVRDEF